MDKVNRYIKEVNPLEDFVIEIKLCTGSTVFLNMSNRLNTVRFAPLRDKEVFSSVSTDGFYIKFCHKPNYELDFTLREAILMAINEPPNTYERFNPLD